MTAGTEVQDTEAAAQQVREQLGAWVAQVIALRRQVTDAFPAAGSPPGMFYTALLATRAAMDQTEEILRSATSYSRASRRWAQDAEFAEADEFDRRSAQARRAGRGVGDYTTGRERQADVNLQMLPTTRENRAKQRIRDECDEFLETIRITYRGMDSTRQDIATALRYFQWESNLER